MDILNRIDLGKFLTIAGCIVTVAGTLIDGEKQKQANHEIALEVAELLRKERSER